jgi:hypothetical protein
MAALAVWLEYGIKQLSFLPLIKFNHISVNPYLNYCALYRCLMHKIKKIITFYLSAVLPSTSEITERLFHNKINNLCTDPLTF